MATTGFFNGVKKQIRKIVKPIDVRVGKYNNNLKKTNANFDKAIKKSSVHDVGYVNYKGQTIIEPSKRKAQLIKRKADIEAKRDKKHNGIKMKQAAVGLTGGLVVGGTAAAMYNKRKKEKEQKPARRK